VKERDWLEGGDSLALRQLLLPLLEEMEVGKEKEMEEEEEDGSTEEERILGCGGGREGD